MKDGDVFILKLRTMTALQVSVNHYIHPSTMGMWKILDSAPACKKVMPSLRDCPNPLYLKGESRN